MLNNREQFATICLVGVAVLLIGPYVLLDHNKSLTYEDYFKAIPTIIIGLITAYIGWQQHRVASAQKEIAEDKHRLELFEKRFETYQLFLDMAIKSRKLSPDIKVLILPDLEESANNKNLEIMTFLRDNESKLVSLGKGARFIFGPDVKFLLDKARALIFAKQKHTTSINNLRSRKSYALDVTDEIGEKDHSESLELDLIKVCDKLLIEFYRKELPEMMGPYLKMTPYISKN